MTQACLRVFLLESTQNPLSVIYAAYHQCYSSQGASDFFLRE